MLRDMGIIFLLAVLMACQSGYAQDSQNSIEADRIFAPSVGEKFYNVAYETGNDPNAGLSDIQQAIIFMQSATLLDKQAAYVLPDMIRLAAKYPDAAYFELMMALLDVYVTDSADLQVTQTGIQYLLDQLNSRKDREALLSKLITTIGEKNKWLSSEISTTLGSFNLEKAEPNGANFYFMQAYNENKYNRLAFENLLQVAGPQVKPSMYLQYLNDSLDQNPLDITISNEIAKYSQQHRIYDISTAAYSYCADLYEYLNPSKPLPAWIYLPWSISAYNTSRDQNKCLQIAKMVRQSGVFDLVLESLAGKAAMKANDIPQAEQILMDAETKALQLLAEKKVPEFLARQQLAWFYSFVVMNPDKALSNANKAYSLDPNSPVAASYLAYALTINKQIDLAKSILTDYNDIPVANLAKAKIMLSQGDKTQAIAALKTFIEKYPDLLESEEAKRILAENGSEVVTSPELIAKEFENIPKLTPFIKPENYISLSLNVQGGRFAYGSKIDGSISIENRSSRPLVISDYGLIKGNIRVDAVVKGDIQKQFPELVSIRFRPSSPIKAGQTILIPIRIVTGRFKQLLDTYPQATLNVELTAYIDPVISDGKIENRIAAIKPVTSSVSRPGVTIDNRYLQNRLDAMSKGQQGQRILVTQLFAGLLREQKAMANRQPLYKFVYADWMPALLQSAIQHSIEDSDWIVKVHTMVELLNLPLDYKFTNGVSENLNDSHWPVRLMAIYLLAKNKNEQFAKVLDYYAQFDKNKFVRDMAVSLGGKAPQIKTTVPAKDPNSPTEPNTAAGPNSLNEPNSIIKPNSAIEPNSLLNSSSAQEPNRIQEPDQLSPIQEPNTPQEPNSIK